MNRIEQLARIERFAWEALSKAHTLLADQPADDDSAALHRVYVGRAEARWRRALTDVDRALSRPVQEEAA
jgi:hypothetical protein